MSTIYFPSNLDLGAGEQSKALVALAEDPGSISSAHMAADNQL